ncbi:MAG TPA: fibronectin type III domain-containing protein [Nitrospira sp.]|nr:fibronectin type III domain-containing protein [Nitrospira sp.]
MGRSTAPHASASVSPRTDSSRLPGALQRLFRDNPAFTKLLQVAPPVASTPPPSQSPPSTVPPSVSPINKVTLTWMANKESDLAGYKVYVGTSSGHYDFPGSPFVINKITTYIVTNLQQNTTYFFAVSAYDLAGNESPLSAEVSKSIF